MVRKILKKIKDDFFERKRKVAELFGANCYVCQKKFGRGFTFHHLWYVEGEPTYRDFKDNRAYQEYILPIVLKNPKQFMLLCRKHHSSVEKLKRFKPETLKRLLEVLEMSRRDRGVLQTAERVRGMDQMPM